MSGPQKIQELTLQALKTMLEKQQTVFEQLTLDYTKVPSERLEQEVGRMEEQTDRLKWINGWIINVLMNNSIISLVERL